MKKVFLMISVLAIASLVVASTSFALTEEKTFTLTATIDAATGISIDAFKKPVGSGSATLVPGLELDFDPMTPDPVNNIWLPDHYFFVNVAPTGGAGNPTTTIKYTEGNNPNSTSGGNGLGYKANIDFTKVTGYGSGEDVTPIPTHPKKILSDIPANGEIIQPTEVSGGYLRVFLGINDGSTSPANGEVFTNADNPGAYSGSLLVSATIS